MKCKICGCYDTESTTAVPEICSMCAMLTGRCQECGKIKDIGND